MKTKYKKIDKLIDFNKDTSLSDKNNNYSSAFNLKKAKSPTNKNSIIDKAKPILNRFNRLYQQKEKEKVKENILSKEDEQNNNERKYKDFQSKKNVQINEKDKESKNKSIYKFTRLNINKNSFISNEGMNLNDTKKEKENLDESKKNEKDNTQNNNIIKRNEKNNLSNNLKLNSAHLSKLISYNSKTKNKNKYNKINEDTSSGKKEDNLINKKENNIDISNNADIMNMKSISIRRRQNYSKFIDKINQNKNLIQTNKTKNKITFKDKNNFYDLNNKDKEDIDNENNKSKYNYAHKKEIFKILKENNEKRNNMSNSKQKNFTEIGTDSALSKTEITQNEEKSNKDNISETSSFISNNKFIHLTIKPKQSFQFLIHQASKNQNLSNSFHKYYESNKIISRGPSQAQSERDDFSMNSNTDEHSTEKHKFRNLSVLKTYKYNEGDSFSSLNSNANEKKLNSLTDRKNENNLFNKNNISNIKVLNFNNNGNLDENDNKVNNNEKKSSIITNNIINNNVFNTTLNFYKISNVSKSKLNLGRKNKALSSKNLMESDEIIYEDEVNMNNINNNRINLNNSQNMINDNMIINNYPNNQKEYNHFTIMSHSSTNSIYMPLVNLECFFSLEQRFQLLLDKINKYQICDKECLDYILFFFDNKIYEEEAKIFKNKHNKNNFLYNIKIEILCFFLSYDISFSKNFNQAAILLKTIFNIIHSNFLIFISYIINLFQYNNCNIEEKLFEILNKFQIIINQELKIHLIKQDMNEYSILQIITNNSKNINNYYKMLIDNLYGQNYINDDNNIKFPQCLNNQNIVFTQNKLQNIISAFFFDAYRLLTNYNYNDLFEFFNIFLNRTNIDNNLNNNIEDINYNNYNDYNINENNNIAQNNIFSKNKLVKYLLPKMKKYFKYSLVLDLDETLICIKRDSNNNIKLNKNNLIALILRPGLLDFLHKMKQLYELILFSSGTSEYVSPIVKSIEKKEKFFEHILYRQHVTYDDNGNFFKNLNLLNRNVKNIIIVDDTYRNFKYHKLNGICIKPFYGDVYNDKNTLKILGSILYKIRFDADITGDIRISLNKEKNSIVYSQIANNF